MKAEKDTVRFHVYYGTKHDDTPIYETFILSPGATESWGIDASNVRADSIKIDRKTTTSKASVAMYK